MSKVISVRIPNAIHDQLKKTGRPIKDQIILALNRYFYYENQSITGVNEEKIPLSHEDLVLILDELFKAKWGDSDG